MSEEQNSWILNIISFLVFVTLILHMGVGPVPTGSGTFCCFSGHLLAFPAVAGTAAASAASSAIAIVATTAIVVVKTRAIAEAAAEAADAAAVPTAAGKASKCPEKQQTKKSQTQLGLDPVLDALDVTNDDCVYIHSLKRCCCRAEQRMAPLRTLGPRKICHKDAERR